MRIPFFSLWPAEAGLTRWRRHWRTQCLARGASWPSPTHPTSSNHKTASHRHTRYKHRTEIRITEKKTIDQDGESLSVIVRADLVSVTATVPSDESCCSLALGHARVPVPAARTVCTPSVGTWRPRESTDLGENCLVGNFA